MTPNVDGFPTIFQIHCDAMRSHFDLHAGIQCRDPPIIFQIYRDAVCETSPVFVVTLNIGDPSTIFQVHHDALCEAFSVLKATFERGSPFPESESQTAILNQGDPRAFVAICHRMYIDECDLTFKNFKHRDPFYASLMLLLDLSNQIQFLHAKKPSEPDNRSSILMDKLLAQTIPQ